MQGQYFFCNHRIAKMEICQVKNTQIRQDIHNLIMFSYFHQRLMPCIKKIVVHLVRNHTCHFKFYLKDILDLSSKHYSVSVFTSDPINNLLDKKCHYTILLTTTERLKPSLIVFEQFFFLHLGNKKLPTHPKHSSEKHKVIVRTQNHPWLIIQPDFLKSSSRGKKKNCSRRENIEFHLHGYKTRLTNCTKTACCEESKSQIWVDPAAESPLVNNTWSPVLKRPLRRDTRYL